MEAAISCKFHCKRLEGHWKGYWPDTDPAALATDVAERLGAATAGWELEGIQPFDGGVVALTCAATRHGRPVVLKLNPRGHSDDVQLAAEGDALAFWRATGAAVDLLGQRDDGFTLLLERLRPGDTLEAAGLGVEDRLAALGRLVARLHRAGQPRRSFVHVRDFAPEWEIPDSEEEVLTHLDLHAGNALRTRGGWKAIDPKGTRADRHADVWALIDPLTMEDFPRDPNRPRPPPTAGWAATRRPPRWTSGRRGSGRASAREPRRGRCTTPTGRRPCAGWPTRWDDPGRR